MATVALIQALIDKIDESEEHKSSIPAEERIKHMRFNLESQIQLDRFKRILIIGMGGGCDVFSAYSYYKYLSNHSKSSHAKQSPVLLFGNCTSIRDDLKKHKKVCNYLYEIHTHQDFVAGAVNKHYGTTKLEESIPFEYDKDTNVFHGPYLIAVPIKRFSSEINNIGLATMVNNEALSECFNYLNVDLIIGIDNGGDSLTCGIDYSNDPELARDRQVLYAMKHNKYNTPYIHYVFGPGCDGESTVRQLLDSVEDENNRFIGAFQLNDGIMNIMRDRSKLLSDYRTPNIMYSAFIQRNEENSNDLVTIPRGRTPRIHIPKHWLHTCWAFSTVKCNKSHHFCETVLGFSHFSHGTLR
eukprot:38646_1